MKKLLLLSCLFLLMSCENYGQLKVKANLSKSLNEVSGIQYSEKENGFWMLNDSGNKPHLYLVSEAGKILRELKIDKKNNDWEDLTQDKEGNIYIGDFGNNKNERKDLRILKVKVIDLKATNKIEVEKIEFYYPEQQKFPPKKKNKYYDTEAFFELDGFFYIFTKSRVKDEYGKTFLYQVPNKKGNHKAKLISQFETIGTGWDCSITGADISKDGKKVALITHQAVWVFSDFNAPDFFSGNVKEYPFTFISQKESVTFKNDSTIYIADEQRKMSGRNLYLFELKN